MDWSERSFLVGMPHMIPNQLSEVELLKVIGDAQWQTISKILGRPSTQIVNDRGDRLYSSFINIELSFAEKYPIDFGEGKEVHVSHASRFYARRFVEGFFCFDDAPLSPAKVETVTSRSDLERVGTPWVYLTNAFVAREGSNLRLKTFAPVGEYGDKYTTDIVPPGIQSHELVERTGQLTISGMEGAVPIATQAGNEILYTIVPESDLNGVGLLYFARYVAIANYGDRLFLRHCAQTEVSAALIGFLNTVRRRIFYFANATEHDSIKLLVNGYVSQVDKAAAAPSSSVTPLKFYFVTELVRQSDGGLIAKSVVEKHLIIPKRNKSAILAAGRLGRRLGLPMSGSATG